MTRGILGMSRKELTRLEIGQAVVAKRTPQSEAVTRLGLSARQVKRAYRRGKPPTVPRHGSRRTLRLGGDREHELAGDSSV